jgi:hypothetical protein
MERYQGIDTTLLDKLSALSPQVAERFTHTALFSAIQSLSGQPIDSYERMKQHYFGTDYKFPTLKDIEVPSNFNSLEYGDYVTNYQKEYTNTLTQQLTAYQTIAASPSSLQYKVCELSGISNIRLSDEMIKNNIRYSEFIQTVTLNDIYNNPDETCNKILTFYVNNLKQKY